VATWSTHGVDPQQRPWSRAADGKPGCSALTGLGVFLFYAGLVVLHSAWAVADERRFARRRDAIPWRVHVNGIRGKSTVTRYLAAVFRAAGWHAFGKTTGSAARVLTPTGVDTEVGRRGYPDVGEQVRLLRAFARQGAEAVVMECMAVNPVYARWLEERVMHSHVGVITNVRLDHTDYLGETLEEIAAALALTIPRDGVVITAEHRPSLLAILQGHAERRGSRLLHARGETVPRDDLRGFSHFAIEDNVAIGYAMAEVLGLPRPEALAAMQAAPPDPGAMQVLSLQWRGRPLVWANLFAVNDRESFVDLTQRLTALHPGHRRIVILNNRLDRPTRVEQFSDLAIELGMDDIVSFGDYEETVNECCRRHGRGVINLGNASPFRDSDAGTLLDAALSGAPPGEPVLLIGTVNIHTPQAEALLQLFDGLAPR
jgi:poly-gamma-glutamate synthase PgsB/CapB